MVRIGRLKRFNWRGIAGGFFTEALVGCPFSLTDCRKRGVAPMVSERTKVHSCLRDAAVGDTYRYAREHRLRTVASDQALCGRPSQIKHIKDFCEFPKRRKVES